MHDVEGDNVLESQCRHASRTRLLACPDRTRLSEDLRSIGMARAPRCLSHARTKRARMTLLWFSEIYYKTEQESIKLEL